MNLKDYIILPRKDGSEILVAKHRSHDDETWEQAYYGLIKEDSFMPTIRDFIDRLNHLRSGRVCDDDRERVEISDVLFDTLNVRKPYRAEWLDARFMKYKGDMHVVYHKLIGSHRVETFEPLDSCLMEDRQIDLEYWLANATPQGLPPKDTPQGDLFYWYPKDNSAVRFVVDPERIRLFCNGSHQNSYPGLGVRAQKLKKDGQ